MRLSRRASAAPPVPGTAAAGRQGPRGERPARGGVGASARRRRACSGMCVAGSGRARAVMKMRSGKVVPLCSINQGGKENGCERQSPETAPREAGEAGEGEFCREQAGSGPWRSPSSRSAPWRDPSRATAPHTRTGPLPKSSRLLTTTTPFICSPSVSSLCEREEPCIWSLQEPVVPTRTRQLHT